MKYEEDLPRTDPPFDGYSIWIWVLGVFCLGLVLIYYLNSAPHIKVVPVLG
jgi:hypothetical protein